MEKDKIEATITSDKLKTFGARHRSFAVSNIQSGTPLVNTDETPNKLPSILSPRNYFTSPKGDKNEHVNDLSDKKS